MTHFTTSKGGFIAVPVPISGWAPGNYMNTCRICKTVFRDTDKLSFQCVNCAIEECKFNDVLPDIEFEIIGLSSDILKDEELASNIVDTYHEATNEFGYKDYQFGRNMFSSNSLKSAVESFESLLRYNNITGNQLIIKRLVN